MIRGLWIAVLFISAAALAIDLAVRDTWSGIGVGFNANGIFTGSRCDEVPFPEAASIEFPLGSHARHTWDMSIWLGAEVQVNGYWTPRVSTGDLPSSNPSVNELHPPYGSYSGIRETSHFDTTYDLPFCTITPETDFYSRADHEFSTTFTDTLTDPMFVGGDEFDGPHAPLGLQVEMTSYSFADFCRHVTWIRLNVTNIGPHNLRNLWCGLAGDASVYIDPDTEIHGAVGFDHEGGYAYVHAQTGRAVSPISDVVSPGAIGLVPLLDAQHQSVSFNWWTPAVFPSPFGPAWESYADRDSCGLGWTRVHGDPQGDRQRYQLMSNRELDCDPLRFGNTEWIDAHASPNQRWSPNGPDMETFRDMLQSPFPFLLSSGPHGVRRDGYVSLNSGESADIWFAVVGGAGFNDESRPHPTDFPNPDLYDLTDLRERAWIAKDSPCFSWLDASEPRVPVAPEDFRISEAMPNPFNGETRISFMLPRGTEFELGVFDLLGRQTDALMHGVSAGDEIVARWTPQNSPSGVYFFRLCTNGKPSASRKVLFLK